MVWPLMAFLVMNTMSKRTAFTNERSPIRAGFSNMYLMGSMREMSRVVK